MIPYFILMFIIIVLSLFKNKLGNKIYLICLFVCLFLFLILKDYNYYPDHDNYLKVFNLTYSKGLIYMIQNYKLSFGYEIGYVIYNGIVTLFTSNYFVYLIITSVITLIGYFYFIKNNSNNYFFSILIFMSLGFYSMNFYILRSSIAVSIMLFSLKYLKERKILKYMLLTLLASSFHQTMLVFIPLYFLLNIDYNKYFMIFFSVITLFIFIFKNTLISILIDRIYPYYKNQNIFTNGGYKLLLLLVILFGIICLYKKKLINQNKDNKFYINMLMYGIFFQVLATSFGPINRITTYLTTSLIILIPNFLSLLKNTKWYKYINVFTIICLLLIFTLKVVTQQQFYDYHLIF